ncbi:MAG TPA: response regulator, partial [Terriglobales bacterium]|nr:response regulator [Terriglobales bacterium]
MRSTIFVVEDDADIARLVRHHLEAAGYGVRAFASAPGVIAEAEQERPMLMLLDIMVPGGDGLDLCRRIRETPAIASTPVIFLTARTAEA